jgi:hypothetical protein
MDEIRRRLKAYSLVEPLAIPAAEAFQTLRTSGECEPALQAGTLVVKDMITLVPHQGNGDPGLQSLAIDREG